MEEHLAYFEGFWPEEERHLVKEAIAWKEKTTELPPYELGEPWVVISEDVGERRVLLAYRHGWSRPVKASTPDELASAIRDR